MKLIPLYLLVLSYSATFAQTGDICDGLTKPGSGIGQNKAKKRINKFNTLKLKGLTDYNIQQKVPDIGCTKDDFEQMLVKFTGTNNSGIAYDGFRVYFAAYPRSTDPPSTGQAYIPIDPATKQPLWEGFTLVFVPTTEGADLVKNFFNKSHVDDLSRCYIVVNGKLQAFDVSTASGKFIRDWVANYQLRQEYYLNYSGNGHVNKRVVALRTNRLKPFSDTESMFYEKAIIKNGKDGLLEYIQCPKSNVTNIEFDFAAYLRRKMPWSYQMTLVFRLLSPSADLKDGSKSRLVSYRVEMESVDSDTGKPCPPPSGGCQLSGALLTVSK